MVTSTRSGQLKKDESPITSKNGDFGRKEKDIKGSANITRSRSIVRKGNGGKCSPVSGSSADSSTSRKSIGQAPAKNMNPSPNTRRSKRLASCEPSVSPDERNPENIEEGGTQSPLRRSKRIKEHADLSSSGLVESKKSCSPLDKRNQKDTHEGGKSTVYSEGEENMNMKPDVKPAKLVSQKRKRLDARTYRAVLKSGRSPKKVSEDIDVRGSQQSGDTLSHNESFIPRPDDFVDARELEELHNEKEEMIEEHDPSEFVNVPRKGSSPNSREPANRTLEDRMEGESAYLEGKQTIHSNEVNESGLEGSWSDAKCIDSSGQSLSSGATARSIGNDTERPSCFARGVSRAPDLSESISERKLSLNVNLNHHSSVSVAPMVSVDAMPFSLSGNKDQVTEQCTVCCKQKSCRANDGLVDQDLCSCDGNIVSSSQGGCAPQPVPENYKDRMLACSGNDDSAKKLADKSGGKSTNSQREVILTDLSNLFHTSTNEEDRRLEVTYSVDSPGEPNTLRKVSSWAIQPNTGDNSCIICKRHGSLLCCDGKGCKRSYHLSCIDPPLKEVPPGIWHCLYCVRKKIELGFHSISEGMESILDVRLVDSTYSDGMCKEKQYLVKYKGLAHVHNRWVSEKELLLEAPSLLGKFNRRKQRENVTLWQEEWTVPQRLLQRRLIMQPELADECFSACGGNARSCYYEWFVKWTGLGYEHATWEFENSSFLRTPEAMALIRDYESRHGNAKKPSDPSKSDKIKLKRQVPLSQLPMLPDGCSTLLDGDHLNSVNKLRGCWHKSQSIVFHDEQERIMKVILFILSIEPNVSRPFLIISTSISLSLWESEFRRLAPSTDVVVYSGNKDVRKMIRSLEFFEEDTKFHVLLSPPHAIVEDYDALDFIFWEALVVDDCQHLGVSKHLEQLRKLSSDFRLILYNGQLKDNIAEYLNLLSFLDSGGSQCSLDGTSFSCNIDTAELAIVKDRLSKYIARNRKVDCSKFLEYWVPVELSTVQLEQYCATLISHSSCLRSCSKVDQVGVLRDILISQRKCCDHPYLVDEFLQAKLMKDLQAAEYLDIGVKASGKLELLDKILREMKGRGQRVVILFQLVGRDGKSTIGDILDDFLRQRFGVDSYERVESGLSLPKKQSALSMFNSKQNGRFVFLIENRACLPSIRLSSVDAVIIFSSDWNPASDLRALQKISLESLSGYVKVFRLYSSFTVEEKALILAKQDKTLDSSISNISRSVSQSLLSWGASYIFNKLDEFHRSENPKICSITFSGKPMLNDVLAEFVMHLPQNAGQESIPNYSIIAKAQQIGASYSKDILLLGEKETPVHSEEAPHVLWSSLLDGRYPRWRFVSDPSQRARRKPLYPDALLEQPEGENDEARKKRRKVVNGSSGSKIPDDNASMKSKSVGLLKETKITPVDLAKEPGAPRNEVHMGEQFSPGSPGHNNDVCHNQIVISRPECTSAGTQSPTPKSEEGGSSQYLQRSLHLLLKPELTKLCETLRLSVDVSNMAQLLLEYVMSNNRVGRDSESILQAFKISLCWRAASILKLKLDHRASLLLARQHLNYGCTEQEAESVYLKLRMLKKKKFKEYTSRNVVELNSYSQAKNLSPRQEIESELLREKSPVPAAFDCQELEEGNAKRNLSNRTCPEWQFLPAQDQLPAHEVSPMKHHLDIGQLNSQILSKRIDLIEKTCSKRIEKLLQKQQLEVEEFNNFRECEKARQQKAHKMEVDLLCTINLSCEVKDAKLHLLKQVFSSMMEKFEEQLKVQRRKLVVMQVKARNKEQQIRECWLAEAKSGTLVESFDKIPLADTGFTLDELSDPKQVGAYDDLRNALSVCGQPDSIHQDNVPADCLPPTSRTAEEFPGVGMAASPDSQAAEKNKESECAPTSTAFEIQGPSPSAQALSNSDRDSPPPSHQVPSTPHEKLPLLDGFDSRQDLNSSRAGTTVTSQSSDSVPAQIHPTSSDSVPAQLHPASQLSDSAPVQFHPASQLSDSVPVQLVPSDDLLGHNSIPLLPEVCPDWPSVQPVISCTELSPSRALTVPSIQIEDQHRSDMNCSASLEQWLVEESSGLVEESSGTRVHSQTTLLDELATGERLNSPNGNTFTGLHESFRDMSLPTEASDQLIEQTTGLDGLSGEVRPDSSQNLSHEIIDSSLQSQATTDLSTALSDIQHTGTTGGHGDEFIADTCHPTDQIQISAQQSFGPSASQAGHSDIGCTTRSAGGQELNSSRDSQLQMPATADASTDFSFGITSSQAAQTSAGMLPAGGQEPNSSHDTQLQITAMADAPTNSSPSNPFAHQVQLLPDFSFGITYSQAGQTSVRMQPSVSMPLGRMESPRVTTDESNIHLLQALSMVPQASLHDPLQNELNRLRKDEDRYAETCEMEKQRLKLELEKELEQVRKKYESLINDEETKFGERKKTFALLYNKVYLNRVLAEEFRSKFNESKSSLMGASSQGTGQTFVQQVVHASLPNIEHREALASFSAAMPLVFPGPVRAPSAVSHLDIALSSERTRVPGPIISPVSSSPGLPVQVVHHSSALFSSNPPVHHLSPVVAHRGNFQAVGERAPAPHLHPFRASASTSMPNFSVRPGGSLGQQQLPSHSIASMHPQVVHAPLSVQRMGVIGGTRRQENLSMRPVINMSQPAPCFAADVRDECTRRNLPTVPPSLELDQRRSFEQASGSTVPGQPTPSSEAAAALQEVICLLDD